MISLRDISLVDSHTHCQPSMQATGEFFGRIGLVPPGRAGTPAELVGIMDRNGIKRSTIVPWLPAQDLVRAALERGVDRDEAVAGVVVEWSRLNQWATDVVSEYPGRFTCLVGVDPVLMPERDLVDEVRTRLANGAIGIKIAPMFFGVRPDDQVVEVVWRLAAEHGVYVLSACGTAGFRGDQACAQPEHFEAVLSSYPSVVVQLAQMGHTSAGAVAGLTARHQNVMTDTALRLEESSSPEEMANLIRRIGVERVMFGTNYPVVDPEAYGRRFRALPLSETELQQVGVINADRLHGV
jgi:predicted TIM-barrel fold metal-dependent hydrolase